MLLRAYTLHDVKALSYSPPFFVQNDAMAVRMVKDLVSDNNTTVGRHPSDYKLYCIGFFEDDAAKLTSLSIMEHVTDCIALVPPPANSLPFGVYEKIQEEWFKKANGEAK